MGPCRALTLSVAVSVVAATLAAAQTDFYAGKSIQLLIGFSAAAMTSMPAR